MSRSRTRRGVVGQAAILTPSSVKESTGNLLQFLLFMKAFLLVISISFISIALLNKEEDLRDYFPRRSYVSRRTILFHAGSLLGLVTSVFALANSLALLGLKTWNRFLLLPYIGCLIFGALISFYNVGRNLFLGFQQVCIIVSLHRA